MALTVGNIIRGMTTNTKSTAVVTMYELHFFVATIASSFFLSEESVSP